MSNENLKTFFRKYKEDSEFRKAIDNAPDIDAKRRIIIEAGLNFTKQDVEELKRYVKHELSDAELDYVVGGTNALYLNLKDEDFEAAKDLGF